MSSKHLVLRDRTYRQEYNRLGQLYAVKKNNRAIWSSLTTINPDNYICLETEDLEKLFTVLVKYKE